MCRIARSAVALLLAALLLAACENTATPPPPGAAASSTPSASPTLKAALVVDVSDPTNSTYAQLATTGYNKAQQEYGFPSVIIQSKSPNDYINDLGSAAQEADIVVVVGFALQVPLDKVAKNYPNTKFAMVDGCAVPDPGTGACETLSNVAPLTFNVQEAGCVVGALAAQMEIDGQSKISKLLGKSTIGAIGAQPIPSVIAYIAGYQYCAKKVDKDINVVISYSNDFSDPAQCQTLAGDQIANQHADIIFQVARGCGDGVFAATAAKNVFSIGSDIDQSKDAAGKARSGVITSALKNVDTAVYYIINTAENGQFATFIKHPTPFGLANGGVDFATPGSDVPQDATSKAQEYQGDILSGSLTPPAQLGK